MFLIPQGILAIILHDGEDGSIEGHSEVLNVRRLVKEFACGMEHGQHLGRDPDAGAILLEDHDNFHATYLTLPQSSQKTEGLEDYSSSTIPTD